MIKLISKLSPAFMILILTVPAHALDQITRPYLSVRSMGMGSTRITTGLYDDNFFNNPARVTANPSSKFTFFDITPLDINTHALRILSPLMAGQDPLTTISDSAGDNIHERFQMVLPAYYLAATGDRRLALAFGMFTSVQTDVDLRESYRLNLGAVVDVGPALTVGYKVLPNETLTVGVTSHISYRISTDPNYSLVDYIGGTSPSIGNLAGDGSMLDFDLGVTSRIAQLGNFEITFAAAIQNLLGGTYSNLPLKPLNFSHTPMNQPRSYGLGISAVRPSWGFLQDTTFAIEASDVLNNTDGSLFRLIHIGAETRWRSFLVRLGLNQGYWTAGMTLDVRFITLNFATYGEELGLNAGILEDRRYAASVGIHF